MKQNSKILRILLLTLFGVWFTHKSYNTYHEDFVFDGIILLFIALVGFSILVWTINKDFKAFEKSSKISSFLASSIGLLFILVNLGLFYHQNAKMNSPTLIRGFYDGGFNGFSVDFKTDGNYIMANGSGLGQSYFYGKYSLSDSIITIDKSNIDNVIKSNKLVIRTEQYYLPLDTVTNIGKANYITQIDETKKEISREYRFRVTQDNRSSANK